jgi:hypothetical protein
MSPLAPDRYIDVRLDDQLKFFRKKAIALDTLLERLQWGILGVGGLGTLLAAIGFDRWVTLTTAIATALGTYLSYRGVDPTLTNHNQTAIDLENIKGCWTALRPDEQGDPSNVDALVRAGVGGRTQRLDPAYDGRLGQSSQRSRKRGWVVLRDPEDKGPNLSFQGRDRRPRSRSWHCAPRNGNRFC